jgi:hypothetical protein
MAGAMSFTISIDPDLPLGALDESAHDLRSDLLEIPGTEADFVEGVALVGTKSGAVTAVGTMLVSLVSSAASVHLFAKVLVQWFERTSARKIVIKHGGGSYTFDAPSAETEKLLRDTVIGLLLPASENPDVPGIVAAASTDGAGTTGEVESPE